MSGVYSNIIRDISSLSTHLTDGAIIVRAVTVAGLDAVVAIEGESFLTLATVPGAKVGNTHYNPSCKQSLLDISLSYDDEISLRHP